MRPAKNATRAAARRLGTRLCALVLGASLASGCSTVRTVSPTTSGYAGALRAGDRVRVFRHDGTVLDLFVTDVRDDALAGEPDLRGRAVRDPAAAAPVVVPLADVARVERSEFSSGKTIAFAGVVAGIAAVYALLLAWAHSWEDWGARPARAAPTPPAR